MSKLIIDILKLAKELDRQQDVYNKAAANYSIAAKEAGEICLALEERFYKERERDARQLGKLKAEMQDPRQVELADINRRLKPYDIRNQSEVMRHIYAYQHGAATEFLNEVDQKRLQARRKELQEALATAPCAQSKEIAEIEARRYKPMAAESKKLKDYQEVIAQSYAEIKAARYSAGEAITALQTALNNLANSNIKPSYTTEGNENSSHERLLGRICAAIEGKANE